MGLILISCSSNKRTIDSSSVSYIVLSISGKQDSVRLGESQQQKFVKDWNKASDIGPWKFFGHYKVDVVLKDSSKRTFFISGNKAKEPGVNDYCYDLSDTAYFQKMWEGTITH